MYTDINHQEQYTKRCQIARALESAGLNLLKTGHIFIVRGQFGSLYQSHSIIDIENWINEKRISGNLMTCELECPEVDSRIVAVKYSKTIRL